MLLRNESRIKHSIMVRLVFDDKKVREIELNEGDKIQVSYRKNGYIKAGVGVVRNIKPYRYYKRHHGTIESALILVDMSDDHRAFIERIDLYHIMDIRHLNDCDHGLHHHDHVHRPPHNPDDIDPEFGVIPPGTPELPEDDVDPGFSVIPPEYHHHHGSDHCHCGKHAFGVVGGPVTNDGVVSDD